MTCYPEDKIDQVFQYVDVSLVVLNQFFDEFDTSENPIKNTLQNFYFTVSNFA